MNKDSENFLEIIEHMKYSTPETHSDIEVAEREREMSSMQLVKVSLLRLEEAVRLRDTYTSMNIEHYNKQKNNFRAWISFQGSAALAHPYHFEKKSTTKLFLRDFLNNNKYIFDTTDDVENSKDLKLLWKLVEDYEKWVTTQIDSKIA